MNACHPGCPRTETVRMLDHFGHKVPDRKRRRPRRQFRKGETYLVCPHVARVMIVLGKAR